MRGIIEKDLCAGCAELRPSQPLPLSGIWEIPCECAQGWSRCTVNPSANAISACPSFIPRTPWPARLIWNVPAAGSAIDGVALDRKASGETGNSDA
jgi:hypothetical protein